MNSFHVILSIIQDILEEENVDSVLKNPYLPEDVSNIFKEIIKLHCKFDRLSKSVAVARNAPPQDYYDIHTV